jgi:hypothetical protein
MDTQGESTTMATSSSHDPQPPTKPTLSIDQPLPHIFETLLSLQDDVAHLIQITLEHGSKIQEQETRIKELVATCELLQETQLDNRVGLRAIHDHLLPQSKGKEPEGQGRVLKVTRFRWKVCTRIYATIFAVQELSKELQSQEVVGENYIWNVGILPAFFHEIHGA